MKFFVRSLVAVAVASTLGACASGGGGSGETQAAIDGIFCAVLGQDSGCAARARASQGASGAQSEYVRPTLTKWSDQEAETVQTTSLQVAISNDSVRAALFVTPEIRLVSDPVFKDGVRVDLYQSTAQVQYLESGRVSLHYGKPLEGHPGIEALSDYGRAPQGPAEFSDRSGGLVGLAANPHKLGWDYQSFGAWSAQNDRTVTAATYGPATPGAAVPASGNASFVGKLAGLYISPGGQGSMAAADLMVNVDFSRRALNLASSGTTITRDRETVTAAPHLDVSGTLSYAPGSSAFSGTLANAGGTMSGTSRGRFYGPAAQELGGVVALKSASTVEAFTGAYGAKR